MKSEKLESIHQVSISVRTVFSEPMSLTTCFIGVIQKYGRKLKWFGQEQTSFEHESEGRLLPVDNADLIGRVVTVH